MSKKNRRWTFGLIRKVESPANKLLKNNNVFYICVYDYLENEPSHFCEPGGPFLEAVEVLLGEDEEPLFPSGEELVPLLPQQPLLDEGISVGAVARVAGEDGVAVVVGLDEVLL